jgi:hypothetical protein
MSVDRYTKVILTVIAVCLVWLSLGGPSVITPVSAQNDRVYLAGWIEDGGAFRPFPRMPGARRPEAGKPIPPAPLPVWDAVAQPNP